VQLLQRRVRGRRGLDIGIGGRLGGEERLDLGSEGRVGAEEMAGRGGGLAAVCVDEEGGRGAHGFEEDAGEDSERLQAFGVADIGVVERLDEQLAEQLGDVDVIEEAGEAAEAGRGAAFAAGFGLGCGVGGIVEEAEVAAGEGWGGAGVAVGFRMRAAGGGGHGDLRCSSVQVFRRSGMQVLGRYSGSWVRSEHEHEHEHEHKHEHEHE
jgi:hypothetical protein